MTKITEEDVLLLAKLSRLHFPKEDLGRVAKEIESILGYVEQLQSVDLSNYKPTNQVTGLQNVMRPDEAYDYGVTAEELLKNVPQKEGNYIKVRRVIE